MYFSSDKQDYLLEDLDVNLKSEYISDRCLYMAVSDQLLGWLPVKVFLAVFIQIGSSPKFETFWFQLQ